MGEIDWNAELRKIEREFDGLPPVPSAAERRAKLEAERRTKKRLRQRETMAGASVRLMLVVALAVAIDFWPYARSCGFGLFAFLAAEGALVLGGLWTVAYTWRGRLAKTHALAMLVVLWGLVLLSAQVLPRVGYARATAAWTCGVSG